MEIIDLKEITNKCLTPVICTGKDILLREAEPTFFYFEDEEAKNYYRYNIESHTISKIIKEKLKIATDTVHEKSAEGEDAIYYISSKKQLNFNEYHITRIEATNGECKQLFSFNMDNKFNKLSMEVLNDEYVFVFFKEIHELTEEEFENFDLSKTKFGYDKAVLFNMISGEQYEVKDENFISGFRMEFFRATLNNKKCIIFEENYIEPFNKEQIYIDIHMHRKSSKEKFFYKDSLKYITVEDFIKEVIEGKDKITFTEIESKGIEGFERYAGIDEKYLYYQINTFGKENSEAIVMMDRTNLNKKIISIPQHYEDEDGVIANECTWEFESKYKTIFQQTLMKDGNTTIRDIFYNKLEYTYPSALGTAHACIDGQYLITLSSRNSLETNIIEIENNSIKTYKRNHTIFDNYLVLH